MAENKQENQHKDMQDANYVELQSEDVYGYFGKVGSDASFSVYNSDIDYLTTNTRHIANNVPKYVYKVEHCNINDVKGYKETGNDSGYATEYLAIEDDHDSYEEISYTEVPTYLITETKAVSGQQTCYEGYTCYYF